MDALLTAIHKDKKQTSESITAVLIQEDGSLQVVRDIQAVEISKAVTHMLVAIN